MDRTATKVELESRRVIEYGITLPWEHRSSAIDVAMNRSPFAGEVMAKGAVFVRLETLENLAEQGPYDSLAGPGSTFLLTMHEEWALVQAGYAVRETRGGSHRSETTKDLVMELYRQMDEEKT